jgi:hypothetical protein
VDEERSEEALKVVHEAFELSKLTVEQGTRKQ